MAKKRNYLDEYSLQKTVNAKGRQVSTSVYMGQWYRLKNEAEGRAWGKKGFFLSLLAWALYLAPLCMLSVATRTGYTMLFFIVTAVPLWRTSGILLCGWRTEPPYEHHEADSIALSGRGFGIFGIVTAGAAFLGEAVVMALHFRELLSGDAVYEVSAALLCAFFVLCTKKSVLLQVHPVKETPAAAAGAEEAPENKENPGA